MRSTPDAAGAALGSSRWVDASPAFRPIVQYAINPNSFYDPPTARRPQNGVCAIGALIIPVGVLLGVSPG